MGNPQQEFNSIKNQFFNKGSNYSKITGDFTEHLVLYWLSKTGYECARVDHAGIDLIASKDNKMSGTSVKSRSRLPEQETQAPHFSRKYLEDVEKTCERFRYIPYIDFVVDMSSELYVFLISKEALDRRYNNTNKTINWSMTPSKIAVYVAEPEIKIFKMDYTFY